MHCPMCMHSMHSVHAALWVLQAELMQLVRAARPLRLDEGATVCTQGEPSGIRISRLHAYVPLMISRACIPHPSGALDGAAETLTLLAALQAKQAEQLLKKYVREYVMCGQCRALETVMVKGNGRTDILRCSCCNAERLLPPIKGGFIAVRRGERRANRSQ